MATQRAWGGRSPHAPLDRRETRVRLLAWWYPEACEAGKGSGTGNHRFDSCIPSRDGYLWERGSFPELEHAMELLLEHDRSLWRMFRRHHVGQLANGVSEQLTGVTAITVLMPTAVWVPMMVSTAAGYRPGEARAWARVWDGDG